MVLGSLRFMTSKSVIILLSFFCFLPLTSAQENIQEVDSRFWIHAEVGSVWQGKNEAQIPSDTGTRFSIADLDDSAHLSGRIYLGYKINERHELRALYAPLTIEVDGVSDKDINFQGETFQQQVPLEAKYTFNSYRLTYRYRFLSNDRWQLWVGGTAKIRDAEIALTQGALVRSRTNTGFVPLIHFAGVYSFNEEFRFHIDADFLASPYGRAEDVALLAGYQPSERIEYLLGYRTVEGGTDGDNSDVYNFAWLHYLVAGATFRF